MRRKKILHLGCFHCEDTIVPESGKFISLINWDEHKSSGISGISSSTSHYSKLDFHLDCFQQMAGKRFLNATRNPDRKREMEMKATVLRKAINYAKSQDEKSNTSRDPIEEWRQKNKKNL